ncbi:MAG: hypothetical protein ACE5IZ_04030 [Dehalococcoidia bacterium]
MERHTLEEARQLLIRLEEENKEVLAAIRGHPFLRGVADGTLPREALRRFAAAEYWYMRGGVKHFALSVVAAPDLDTQRFFQERMAGELEYLERFIPFAQALGVTEEDLEGATPPAGALNAVNYLFRLSSEGSPADKAVAWFLVGRVFADTCRQMRDGLRTHYAMPAEALGFFDIPHVHGGLFMDAVAAIVSRYGSTPGAQGRLRQVASLILAYEKGFYDALLEATG